MHDNERPVGISNIAWSGEDNEQFLDLIAAEGANGVELAASLVWPEPVEASNRQRAQFRGMVESRGLVITGLHALLFARPDLQLLAEGDAGRAVIDYLRRTVDVCVDLGGRYLVLGGSKNRLRGELSVDEAKRRGAKVLKELGEYAHSRGCFFALEALPPPVCDFVMNLREGEEMVRLVNTPGLRLLFDSGAASVTDKDVSDQELINIFQRVSHCQANDFELLPPGSRTPDVHRRWSRLLTTAGYDGWISIEMRRSDDPAKTIPEAIRFVRSAYNHSVQ